MVIYVVRACCPKCNKYFKHVGRGSYGGCSICGTILVGKCVEKHSVNDPNIKKEVVNIAYGENPRYSATLGVSETQIEEARKLSPQCDWKKFGHSYRPLIKNRAEKLKLMKQCNYEEYDPKDFKGRD